LKQPFIDGWKAIQIAFNAKDELETTITETETFWDRFSVQDDCLKSFE